MTTQPPVTVLASEFMEAATRLPKMKRSPAGGRASIPKDTLISPAANAVLVETPVVSSTVLASDSWQVQVSVDAHKLEGLCEKLSKLDIKKVPDAELELSMNGRDFCVKWRTTTLAVPSLWIKE